MADPTTSTRGLKSRTEEELEKLGEGMTGNAPKRPAPKPEVETKPREVRGTGRSLASETNKALRLQLKQKLVSSKAAAAKAEANGDAATLRRIQAAMAKTQAQLDALDARTGQ